MKILGDIPLFTRDWISNFQFFRFIIKEKKEFFMKKFTAFGSLFNLFILHDNETFRFLKIIAIIDNNILISCRMSLHFLLDSDANICICFKFLWKFTNLFSSKQYNRINRLLYGNFSCLLFNVIFLNIFCRYTIRTIGTVTSSLYFPMAVRSRNCPCETSTASIGETQRTTICPRYIYLETNIGYCW